MSKVLGRKLGRERPGGGRGQRQTAVLAAQQIEQCESLTSRVAPEYEFIYRTPFELRSLAVLPLAGAAADLNQVACLPIAAGRLSIVADVRLRQSWAFQHLRLRDISSSISLAPGEKLSLSIRKTQRTQINETTMRSSESLDSFESAIVDKDVLNVQRSTVSAQQWRVDGNANVSLGSVLNFGASGGFAGSTQSTINTTIEHVAESTVKTAKRLQVLQKIEVARLSETTREASQTRTIENPYRDRALTLNVYELAKDYSVTTQLGEIRPAIVLEITDLGLDREFVLAQGEFLDEALLDRTLAGELQATLQAARLPVSGDHQRQLRRYARFAFHYLFEAIGVLNLDGGNRDENDPWLSFSDDEAFDDAISNTLGRVFMTVATYHRLQADIYSRPPFSPPPPPIVFTPPVRPPWPGPDGLGHDMEVEFAVALADSIETDWAGIEPSVMESLLDIGEKADVVRRIPGFLSIVKGLLKPALAPAAEEAAATESSRRATDVINRVIANLHCNRSYYVQQFLSYLANRTQGYALADLVSRWIRSGQINFGPNTTPDQILQLFDPSGGFIDGYGFVVPLRFPMAQAQAMQFIAAVADRPVQQIFGGFTARTENILIPADGFHIEPLEGNCVLQGVPAHAATVNASVDIQAGP